MFRTRQGLMLTVACAAVSLLLAAAPATAAPRGNWGGSRGGNWGGSRGGNWGGYNSGWGWGGNYGWGGYGNWDRGSGWGGDWDRGFGYRGWGGYYPGYYSGYDSGYYSPSVILDTNPNYYGAAPYYSNYYAVPPDTATNAPDTRAHIEVMVPAPNAEVLFDGAATQQQGTDRMFFSPPLNPGQDYTYKVEARWNENGKPMNMSKTVTVTAGQTATVDFGR